MALEKFMFDRSFDIGGDNPTEAVVEESPEVEAEPEVVVPTFSEEELEAAKQEAFNKGKEEALSESATAIENQIVETTKSISEKLDSLIIGQLTANKDIFSDAIKVSHAVTKKAFPMTTTEQGSTEIENVIRQVLVQVLEEPRVEVHVHPTIQSLLQERVEKVSADTHYDGRLYITADENVAEGDCEIKWSNGGAERNLDDLISQADAIIEANLSSLEGGYVPSPDALSPEELEQQKLKPAEENESASPETQETAPELQDSAENEAQDPIPEPSDATTPETEEPETASSEPVTDEATEQPETATQPQNSAPETDVQDDVAEPDLEEPAPNAP